MAEKRGNFVYNDDGTVAQLVSISGSDSSVTTTDTLPMDMQARLVNTAVTHTNAVVSPSGNSTQSTWQLVPEGMSEFINNLTIDAAIANCLTSIQWSEDGTNTSGKTSTTVSNTLATTQKTSTQWYPVGGPFYKVEVWNNDAAPHTCSANIKFRA